MLRSSCLATALAAAVIGSACNLDVENPNAPDAQRAFLDPSGLQQLEGGAFRIWVQTRGDYYGALPMITQADNLTASWNNAAMRYYSSVNSDCTGRCGWNNSATAPEAAGGPSVEYQWYGYYTVLSSANDVLRAVGNGLCFDDDCAADNTNTSRNKAVAKMLQGMAFAGIAMIYDKGFAADETVDASAALSLPFNTRQEMREAALAKFEQAYAEAGLHTWSTPSAWAGVGAGRAYTSAQIRRLIRTMEAELIAMWPRSAAENAQADWDKVAEYAAAGISSGTPFDWEFFVDVTGRECAGDLLDCVKAWGGSIGTMRVDTRVASMLASNHRHPWPEPSGNPCPTISADRRVGDGSWGPTDNFNGYSTKAATVNAGTDYACSGVAIFPAARGQYHQSNLVHVRYQRLAFRGENLPGFDATGQDPFYTRQMNDLLWAEGLIRGGGSKTLAAEKINNSRVGRGGLVPLTGAESDADMLIALQYEQEIEFMGQGPTAFFNRRRIDGLQAGTPRHMPVPAKELDVLLREVYSFGGPGKPDMSVRGPSMPNLTIIGGEEGSGVQTVREIWEQYMARARASAARRF
jgi:starch-binding outer membrane protein, SusD/RagB family